MTDENIPKMTDLILYSAIFIMAMLTLFMLLHSYEAVAEVSCDDGYNAVGFIKRDNAIGNDIFGGMIQLYNPEDSVNWVILDQRCSYEIISGWRFR
jgi:hypothetical protein